MKTGKEALTLIMQAYDKLSDAQGKLLEPGHKARLEAIREDLEEITSEAGYLIRYPNGKTPKLIEIKKD